MVSIVHAARDLGRVRDISKVLVRHGFVEIERTDGAENEEREPDILLRWNRYRGD